MRPPGLPLKLPIWRLEEPIKLDDYIIRTGHCPKPPDVVWTLAPTAGLPFEKLRLQQKYVDIAKLLRMLAADQAGELIAPPILVCQVKDQFFVIDGHHRATVAAIRGRLVLCSLWLFDSQTVRQVV